MKVQFASDLHLGREYWPLPETDADVVVLAGDLAEGTRGLEWAIGESDKHGKPVVLVLGNHEAYNRSLDQVIERAKRASAGTDVHVLERGTFIMGDTRFLGCTLWTDFLLYGEEYEEACLSKVGALLNDFRCINLRGSKFQVHHAQQIHRDSRIWLERELARPWSGSTVVVTHHAPHRAAIHPSYADDPGTAGFVSDLQPVFDQYRIDLWIYGHTHANIDTNIGKTRLVSNQRGYSLENVPGPAFDPAKIVAL